MTDFHSGRWIVLNGEIYNYVELRDELGSMGYAFRTSSDTEVLLAAFDAWGEAALSRFNGMFAFALWDSRRRRLLLARDRLGKKPLFYRTLRDEGGIVFASELKALLEDATAPRYLDIGAVRQYLTYGYVLSSRSILENIQKLPAGEFLVLEEKRAPRRTRYWDVRCSFENKLEIGENEATEKFLALFRDSVRLRMRSDVPLGAFLSGGLDSSAVVAAMCRERPKGNVRTFSIGFEEESYSELAMAGRTAQFLGTSHGARTVHPDLGDEIDRVAFYADEPFADSSMLPMFYLGGFARRRVSVCLSGDGADEILGGYPTYAADRLARLVGRLPQLITRPLAWSVGRLLPVSFRKLSFDYKVRSFLRGLDRDVLRAHCEWRRLFSVAEQNELLLPDIAAVGSPWAPIAEMRAHADDLPESHYLDRAMYIDLKTWLIDDILVKVDRCTMAHGLEARCPFLDHRLVELSASLPVSLKIRGLQQKYILRQSQKELLPRRVLRQRKRGFNSPISIWIGSSLRPYFAEMLGSGQEAVAGIFRRDTVHDLLSSHLARSADNGLKLFAILMFYLWQRRYDSEVQ